MLGGLEAAVGVLRARSVPHALIGAAAMAGRGVLRATDDVDLLVTDRLVLSDAFWRPAAGRGFAVEVRVGDDDDPLAGMVRLVREPERALDVVVGRHAWQADAIRRAEPFRVGEVEVGLVLASDLVLLKLFAGARQDLLDAEAILAAGDRMAIGAQVDERIASLPRDAREAWQSIRREGGTVR